MDNGNSKTKTKTKTKTNTHGQFKERSHVHRLSLQEDLRLNALDPSKFDKDLSSLTSQTKNINISDHIKQSAYISKEGKGEDGLPKTNQDNYLAIEKLLGLADVRVYAVLDGHGTAGHLISNKVKNNFKSQFENNKILLTAKNKDDVYTFLTRNNYELIKQIFIDCERSLDKSGIDTTFSGTTCVMVFQIGTHIICANVGDSRAILVNSKNDIVKLSRDHKPELPEEKKRIESKGGEISQCEDDGIKSGPYRVWKKDEMYPGIAMSRSIGDSIATELGVISRPEIIEKEINEGEAKFIVLASDGVWEFLTNENVRDMVIPFYNKKDPLNACKDLITKSTDWWEQEDIVVDDITVIALFF